MQQTEERLNSLNATFLELEQHEDGATGRIGGALIFEPPPEVGVSPSLDALLELLNALLWTSGPVAQTRDRAGVGRAGRRLAWWRGCRVNAARGTWLAMWAGPEDRATDGARAVVINVESGSILAAFSAAELEPGPKSLRARRVYERGTCRARPSLVKA